MLYIKTHTIHIYTRHLLKVKGEKNITNHKKGFELKLFVINHSMISPNVWVRWYSILSLS